MKRYEWPVWLTPDHFAHSPEWYESFLGVPWDAIVKLHELLNSDDETLAYQARHVLGITATSQPVRAVLGAETGSDIPGGGAV